VRPASGAVTVGWLAHVPEGRQLFGELTVQDNLRLGAWRAGRSGRGGRRGDRDPERIFAALPALRRLRTRLCGTLSGGEQQMVAVGRALMADPEVLAVDELSLGLAPIVVNDLVAHLRELNRERDMAVLLVEQNARLAFDLCSRAYVLEAGQVVAEGLCADLAESPRLARANLGGASL
jgi:branched-chain amino acid transport system ATP-binding protein